MTTRRHEAWVDRLSDYIDGDLAPDACRALEAHLERCGACRDLLDELRAVVAGARLLGDVEPPRDLWPDIAEAIDGLDVPEGGARVLPFPGARRAARRSGIFMTLPQAVAASVALMMVSTAATWWAWSGRTGVASNGGVPPVGASAATLVADETAPSPELAGELTALQQTLDRVRGRLDPKTVRILDKNLAVIQRAIDESVQALAVDPANAFLKEHLERAYREKAEFLREVNAFVDWEG